MNILTKERTKDFKIEIGTHFCDEKRDMIITDRKYELNKNGSHLKYYKYTCNICGWKDGWILETFLISGTRFCSCCSGKTVVQGINDIPTTVPWMIPYFQGGYDEAKEYTKATTKKFKPICPICKRIKEIEMPIQRLYSTKSIGCVCGDGFSFPEKFIMNMLQQLNINYEFQYKFSFNNKRYDFYLPQYQTIIESHGLQHYWYDDKGWNNETTFNKTIQNDKFKKDIALKNGIINYLEIDCRKSNKEYIKIAIIDSGLFEILGVEHEKINWEECEKFAYGNFLIDICNSYNANNYTIRKLSELFHLTPITIRKYLRVGSKLNLCSYGNDISHDNSVNALKESVGKKKRKIKCVNNGVIFPSVRDAIKYMQNITKTKASKSSMYRVLRGEQDNYKGFIFEYL